MKESFKVFLGLLEKELAQLPHRIQIAFSASCAERAYLNYANFSRLTSWGDPSVLRVALKKAWDSLEMEIPAIDVRKLEQECRSLTPDLDDFSSPDVDVQAAAAQEAAFMITLLLEYLLDKNPSYGVRIATFARDTIDMYVQVIENLDAAQPETENKIENHPLMVTELTAQLKDLATLKGIRTTDELKLFKKMSTNIRRSNIGLE